MASSAQGHQPIKTEDGDGNDLTSIAIDAKTHSSVKQNTKIKARPAALPRYRPDPVKKPADKQNASTPTPTPDGDIQRGKENQSTVLAIASEGRTTAGFVMEHRTEDLEVSRADLLKMVKDERAKLAKVKVEKMAEVEAIKKAGASEAARRLKTEEVKIGAEEVKMTEAERIKKTGAEAARRAAEESIKVVEAGSVKKSGAQATKVTKVEELNMTEGESTKVEPSAAEATKVVAQAAIAALAAHKKETIKSEGEEEAAQVKGPKTKKRKSPGDDKEKDKQLEAGAEVGEASATPSDRKAAKKVKEILKEEGDDGSPPADSAGKSKKNASSTTTKTSWLDTLPKADPPPPLPSGASSSRHLNSEDHVALWHGIFVNFNDFKPPPGEGINKYNWLERKLGKSEDDRHKYGWGEYLRGPFMIFAKTLLTWLKSGGTASSPLTLPGKTLKDKSEGHWMNWKLVVATLYDNFRPTWADMQKERALGKDGNERLRVASTGMVKKILTVVEG